MPDTKITIKSLEKQAKKKGPIGIPYGVYALVLAIALVLLYLWWKRKRDAELLLEEDTTTEDLTSDDQSYYTGEDYGPIGGGPLPEVGGTGGGGTGGGGGGTDDGGGGTDDGTGGGPGGAHHCKQGFKWSRKKQKCIPIAEDDATTGGGHGGGGTVTKVHKMPNVRHLSEHEARRVLRSLGLSVNEQLRASNRKDAGTVIAQDPSPRTRVRRGQAVTIYVGSVKGSAGGGPDPSTPPGAPTISGGRIVHVGAINGPGTAAQISTSSPTIVPIAAASSSVRPPPTPSPIATILSGGWSGGGGGGSKNGGGGSRRDDRHGHRRAG